MNAKWRLERRMEARAGLVRGVVYEDVPPWPGPVDPLSVVASMREAVDKLELVEWDEEVAWLESELRNAGFVEQRKP